MARKAKKAKRPVARKATRRFCGLRSLPARVVIPGQALRARLIGRNQLLWSNNETLRYMFLDHERKWRGSATDKQVVRNAFGQWKAIGIGLKFVETEDPLDRPQIRIGFSHRADAGSWSLVGRDCVDQAKDMRLRTMNLGWPLTDAYGVDTALHEIGHALGFEHEHQNPNAGIVWDEEAVYRAFKKSDGWGREVTRENVIDKLDPSDIAGTDWDPNSIMHYPFEPGLIRQPARYRKGLQPAGGLSQPDIDRAKRFYPDGRLALLSLSPLTSVPLTLDPDQQIDFSFSPPETRKYTIHTVGEVDTFFSVFEIMQDREIFLTAADNSGVDLNASVSLTMVAGRDYVVRLRMHYAPARGQSALIVV